MWKCNRDQVAWEGLPNLSGCKSPEVEDLAKKVTQKTIIVAAFNMYTTLTEME